MGDISNAMQSLVDDIEFSTERRQVIISEMNSDTHNLLERFRLEHMDMATALKDMATTLNEKLSSDRTTHSGATQQFMSDIRSDLHEMSDALREKLNSDRATHSGATQQFMSDIRSDLHEMSDALREKLNSDINDIRSDVAAHKEAIRQFMSDTSSDLRDMANALREKISSDEISRRKATQQFMNELVSDRRGAQNIWNAHSGGTVEKAAPEPVVEEVPEEEKPEEKAAPESVIEITELSPDNRVLEVIAKHPEGIRLVDIGNELGVDWRGLIATVKPLVDEDRVEKIDSLYYPKS